MDASDGTAQIPVLDIVSPVGGEAWQKNTEHVIRWTSDHLPAGTTLSILLVREDFQVGNIIATGLVPEDGHYTWIANNIDGFANHKIRLLCTSANSTVPCLAESRDFFTIPR